MQHNNPENIYTVEEHGLKKIRQLRRPLVGGERQVLPPLDPRVEENLLEPPPLNGFLYWAKTDDNRLYGLFCTETIGSPGESKAENSVFGIMADPKVNDDRANLERIAKNWLLKRRMVEDGRLLTYDGDWKCKLGKQEGK